MRFFQSRCRLSDSAVPLLVVDDEQDIREVLELTLTDAGYTVATAADGREGLKVFELAQPRIVITDIKMPGMDGIELLRRLKRENPETEVIMITGHGDLDLAIESLKLEAADFITKPINVTALEIALRRTQEKILMRDKLKEYTASLEQLIREKSELQDHLASLGLMIGSISHGIKGLLTGLDGGMYLLEKGLSDQKPERISEGWETVREMVERIRKMILDILFYAKKRELSLEQTDLVAFARQAGGLMAQKLKESKQADIRFDCTVSDDLPVCAIDPGYVLAALMNIFDNAAEACQRAGMDREHVITFAVRPDGDRVLFLLADSGVGMDEETRARLFTAFFSSKGRKGTGLGLFIANKIVEQHGGSIEVASAPGRGSRFSIRLPLTGTIRDCAGV